MNHPHKKQRNPAQGINAPQCIITSEENLRQKCALALKRALDLGHVHHEKKQRGITTSLYFYSQPLVEAEIRGKNRRVLPMPDGKRWLHIAIDLHFIADKYWRVNHISIGLLQGDPSSTQKEAVLRAEWQIHQALDDSGHAQPHWHVLSAAGIGELPLFDEVVEAEPGFEAFLDKPQPTPKTDQVFGHFHYAMVTDWHRTTSSGPYQVLANDAALVSWIEGCVRYIRHQLDHVDRKSAKAGPE